MTLLESMSEEITEQRSYVLEKLSFIVKSEKKTKEHYDDMVDVLTAQVKFLRNLKVKVDRLIHDGKKEKIQETENICI